MPDSRRAALSVAYLTMLGLRAAGAALSPALLAHAPLALIATSPFLHHLVLTAPLVPPAAWLPVALGVSVAQCWLGWAFGRAHGPAAVDWLTGRGLIAPAKAARVVGAFERAAPLVLLAVPGPIVATLAGGAGLTARRFAGPMLVAQVVWVGLCFMLGDALTDAIAGVQAVAVEHALPLTVLFFAAAAYRWRRRAQRSRH
jgi:membrane protein DedA with SNARE-associated domain